MELVDQATATALALGLTEVASRSGLPDRFKPLCSLLVGVVVVALLLSAATTQGVLWGLVAGLTASGLWSGTKATAGR